VSGAGVIEDQDDEIGSLRAKLETNAAAGRCHHHWSAPRSLKVFALAASHYAATVGGANTESRLLHPRQHDDAFSAIQHASRNAFVRSIHDLLHDVRRLFDPLLFLLSRFRPT